MQDALYERLVPREIDPTDECGQVAIATHQERYHFASRLSTGRRVLDIACGVGYGSRILKHEGHADSGLGVDVDGEAIALARKLYEAPGVTFVESAHQNFHPDQRFDLFCFLETVEHLPDPADFLGKLSSLTTPRRILVASVLVTVSADSNPYHLHDFTRRSFRRLLTQHGFAEVGRLEETSLIRVLRRGKVNPPFRRIDKIGCSNTTFSLVGFSSGVSEVSDMAPGMSSCAWRVNTAVRLN